MSIGTDLSYYKSDVVILFEYDIFSFGTFATNIAAFTWYLNFENLYAWIDSAFLDVAWMLPDVNLIGSVKTDEGFYLNAGSSALCVSTPGTFYFDIATKGLWVHRLDGNNPLEHPFVYGVTWGYRRGGTTQYYNDIEYEPLLKSIPGISRSKTDYFTSKSTNEGGDVILNNAERTFDKLVKNETVLGNACRIKIGLSHYNIESFYTYFTGYVRNIRTGREEVTFEIKQNTDKLNVPIPQNRYNLSTYPYLNDSNDGKVIPLVYGSVRDFEVICLNETETTPTYYTFKVCDTANHSIQAISAAYIYDGDVRTTLAIVSTDLDQATFTCLFADYTVGRKVTVDCEGYMDSGAVLIENALDIIKDLIVTYTPALDNVLYFNTTYWDDALVGDIGKAIDKETDVEKVKDEILQRNTMAHFQIDDDGRFSCVVFDPAAAVDLTLVDSDLITIGDTEDSQENLTAELVVKYNPRLNTGDYEVVKNTDYKDDVNWLYETFNQKELETDLSTEADAIAYGQDFQAQYGIPEKHKTITTNLMLIGQRISNIFQVPFHRPKSADIGTYKIELVGLDISPDDNTTTARLRLFAEVTEDD